MFPKNRLSFLISDGKRELALTFLNSVIESVSPGRQRSGYLVKNPVSKSFMLKALWMDKDLAEACTMRSFISDKA